MKKAYGFGLAGVLLAMLVVTIVSGAGWYVWNQQNDKENRLDETTEIGTAQLNVRQLAAKDLAGKIINSLVSCDFDQYIMTRGYTTEEAAEIKDGNEGKFISSGIILLKEDEFLTLCEKYKDRLAIFSKIFERQRPDDETDVSYRIFYAFPEQSIVRGIIVVNGIEAGELYADVPTMSYSVEEYAGIADVFDKEGWQLVD